MNGEKKTPKSKLPQVSKPKKERPPRAQNLKGPRKNLKESERVKARSFWGAAFKGVRARVRQRKSVRFFLFLGGDFSFNAP